MINMLIFSNLWDRGRSSWPGFVVIVPQQAQYISVMTSQNDIMARLNVFRIHKCACSRYFQLAN